MFDRPILFVGIDGLLCPTQNQPGYTALKDFEDPLAEHREAFHEVRVNHDLGPELLDFAVQHGLELVWASWWGEAARDLGAQLGLPKEMRVIPITPPDRGMSRLFPARHILEHIVRWAGDQWPFVYLTGEELGPLEHVPNLAITQHVVNAGPSTGLLPHHLDQVAALFKMNRDYVSPNGHLHVGQ